MLASSLSLFLADDYGSIINLVLPSALPLIPVSPAILEVEDVGRVMGLGVKFSTSFLLDPLLISFDSSGHF